MLESSSDLDCKGTADTGTGTICSLGCGGQHTQQGALSLWQTGKEDVASQDALGMINSKGEMRWPHSCFPSSVGMGPAGGRPGGT